MVMVVVVLITDFRPQRSIETIAMVPNHRKPLKAMVAKNKNHWKTIDGNGQTAKKHSMVMVGGFQNTKFQNTKSS